MPENIPLPDALPKMFSQKAKKKPENTFLLKFYNFWTILAFTFINSLPFLTFQIMNWLIVNWLLFGELVSRSVTPDNENFLNTIK